MAEQFFYQNRITQSDYRGGATNAPRKHALYLESQLPKLAFKTKKGKETFLNQLYEYVTHFIQTLLGEEGTDRIKDTVIKAIKVRLGIST
jgi:hypothetical protein|tara:strand:+ start:673 stop:942 length:270 start_codon:yes stop_codon:yes gene_type:complete